jgi:hypothetical protein
MMSGKRIGILGLYGCGLLVLLVGYPIILFIRGILQDWDDDIAKMELRDRPQLARCQNYLKQHPNESTAHSAVAMAWYYQGDFVAADQEFEASQAILIQHPDQQSKIPYRHRIETLYFQGKTLEHLGKKIEACHKWKALCDMPFPIGDSMIDRYLSEARTNLSKCK